MCEAGRVVAEWSVRGAWQEAVLASSLQAKEYAHACDCTHRVGKGCEDEGGGLGYLAP